MKYIGLIFLFLLFATPVWASYKMAAQKSDNKILEIVYGNGGSAYSPSASIATAVLADSVLLEQHSKDELKWVDDGDDVIEDAEIMLKTQEDLDSDRLAVIVASEPVHVSATCNTSSCTATVACPIGKRAILCNGSNDNILCSVTPSSCNTLGTITNTLTSSTCSMQENSILNSASVNGICQ